MSTRATSKPAAPEFPLDSYREAAIHLRRPFTPAATRFKVQATWPKGEPHSALVVCYIDARLVVERLNLIIPHLWCDSYDLVAPKQMWCHLTVDGITRSDVGEGSGKGLVSDALKRAAVKFGVGVSLYATPKLIMRVRDGFAQPKQSKEGPTLELTPNGESRVRELYEAWLTMHGSNSFGEPLDHGDVEGAQGDVEAGDLPAEAHETPPELDKTLLDELLAVKKAAALPDTPESREWVRSQVVAVGAQDVPARVTHATLKRLSEQQARELIEVFKQVQSTREGAES